jgi:hypothetical protein
MIQSSAGLPQKSAAIICLEGASAAGKTTLSHAIAAARTGGAVIAEVWALFERPHHENHPYGIWRGRNPQNSSLVGRKRFILTGLRAKRTRGNILWRRWNRFVPARSGAAIVGLISVYQAALTAFDPASDSLGHVCG